jgi:hypothetical protein
MFSPDTLQKPIIPAASSQTKTVLEKKAVNGTVTNGVNNGVDTSSAKKYFLTPVPAEGHLISATKHQWFEARTLARTSLHSTSCLPMMRHI